MTEPSPRQSFGQAPQWIALALSIGTVVWNTAVTSNNVETNAENTRKLETRVALLEREVATRNIDTAEIKAKLDFIITAKSQ